VKTLLLASRPEAADELLAKYERREREGPDFMRQRHLRKGSASLSASAAGRPRCG
jgi:hypothetical protein